jgi:hypothetical protein
MRIAPRAGLILVSSSVVRSRGDVDCCGGPTRQHPLAITRISNALIVSIARTPVALM